jgi:hypothetical protein
VSRPAAITTGCFSSFIKLLPDIKKNQSIRQFEGLEIFLKKSLRHVFIGFVILAHYRICRKIPKGATIF